MAAHHRPKIQMTNTLTPLRPSRRLVSWILVILSSSQLLHTVSSSTAYNEFNAAPFEINPNDNSDVSSSLFPSTNWERCTTHQTCSDCSSSWGCHWCSSDNACHAKGALHGCAIGASCEAHDSQSCFDHKSCVDCSSSQWGCHWCAFDEACHAVGSVHGCATGVNCYAIDRCQRLEPEEIKGGGTFSKSSFEGVGAGVKALVWILAGLVLCCSTLCFAGATAVKCAVDDLVGEDPQMVEDGMLVGGQGEDVEEQQDELEIALLHPSTDGANECDSDGDRIKNDANVMLGDQASVSQITRLSTTSARREPKGHSIRRMYCACQFCYLATFLTTGLLAIISLSYAPRYPHINVCTNQIAWKSIVEGMASLKMSASFDLLISVYNPNRFEVDLDNGVGQFHHDGEYVGSFTIPSAKISAKAISDLVVKVNFTPDKWSALSLTSEYYQGTLKFVVGGHSHVKIPGLADYQFDAKFDDINVNVNNPEFDDTHLCACPGWKKPGHGMAYVE